jgi:hypothetical protein
VADDNDIDASCGGTGGNDRVIAFTAPSDSTFVFDTVGSSFDTKLALYSDCVTEIGCNDDIAPGNLQSELSLPMLTGQTVLVVIDGFNGLTGDYVLNITEIPPLFVCQDEDIGGLMGYAVSFGNTAGDDDDLVPSCGNGGGNDRVVTFTAPVSQDYLFTTLGSSFDTTLSIWADCATEAFCNDDVGIPQSGFIGTLTAGASVLLHVDGYGGATGDFQLNIFGGECCTVDTTPGCIDPNCADTICTADPFCCDTEWDQACVDAAVLEPACVGAGGCP